MYCATCTLNKTLFISAKETETSLTYIEGKKSTISSLYSLIYGSSLRQSFVRGVMRKIMRSVIMSAHSAVESSCWLSAVPLATGR